MGRNHFRPLMFVAQIALFSCVCLLQPTHELVADYLNETREERMSGLSLQKTDRHRFFAINNIYLKK